MGKGVMPGKWNFEGSAMTAKEFEDYARDCVRLAEQAGIPLEVRDELLNMARDWMRSAMAEEDAANNGSPS